MSVVPEERPITVPDLFTFAMDGFFDRYVILLPEETPFKGTLCFFPVAKVVETDASWGLVTIN